MKKVLVTGGNGFIARNLYEQLKNEYEIVCVTRKDLDLLDSKKVMEFIRKKNIDIVIHTATYDAAPKHSTKDPAKVLENNLKMFFNIARCEKYFEKMIHFGSGAEFDREHWVSKMDEEYFDKYIPQDQYGFSKYIMTKHTLASDKIYNLRLFAVFGKYEDYKVRIISSICRDAVLNQTIHINQNKCYDFIDIEDLIKIVKWFIDNKPKHKVYNVCSGNKVDFKTIAEKIKKISGKNLKIEITSKEVGKEYTGNNGLLLDEIKEFKFKKFDESLKELYYWYDKNKKMVFHDVK